LLSIGLGLWRWALFSSLIHRRLLFNIFPFLVSTAQLIGDFYDNRQSAANSYLRFAYSFVSRMMSQYNWSCDSFSANRRSAANKKKSAKTSNWHCEFAALHLLAQRRRPLCPKAQGAT
jgi:hypothetical protein